MLYSLEIAQEAKLDIQEAWLWYEEKQSCLGDDFTLSLEATINLITQSVLVPSKVSGIACGSAQTLPLQSYLLCKGYLIGMIAVFHTSRNPTVWEERYND